MARWILSNVRKLYDGASAGPRSVHEGVDLVVEGERIRELRPHDPAKRAEGDVVVDASRATVTPGLIDCHGHVTVLGLRAEDIERENAPLAPVLIERALFTTLVDGGVTTMRDVGGATAWMKRMVDEGIVIGPRLRIAICMLSSTGGHADFRGPDRCHAELSKLWPPAPGRPSAIVDGPWECRKRVREVAACGADLVKLCTSPGVASPSDRLEHRDLHPEEIEAICDEAAARGLKVAAHAHSRSGIELAVRHGVHDLQHVSFLTEREVELAHERGCTVTPTSWVIYELQTAGGLDPFVMEKVKRVGEAHERALQVAMAGELPILAGTDAVLPGMHGRNWMELHWLIREGLDPLRAWWGMTGLAAREVGPSDSGTLEAGRRADLLVCEGDVIESPARLGEGALLEVVKDGVGHRGGLPSIPQRRFEDTVRRGMWPELAE